MSTEAAAASKEAGIYAYSRIAGSIFVLVALAFGARLYSIDEFAYISAIILLYELAVALGSFGLADAVFFFIAREPHRAPHVVRQVSLLLACLAVPVIAIVCAFGLGMDGEIRIAAALPWLAITILVELPTHPAINQLLAVQRARLASLLYIVFAAFRPLAVLAPAALDVHVELVPLILAVSGLARLVTHAIILGRVFPLQPDDQRWRVAATLRSILLFALPAGVATLGGKLNPQIDKYVVQWVRGNDDFVLYTAAAWELPLITLIPYAIGAVMQARYVRLFAAGERVALRALWLQTIRKTSLLVLPLTTMMIALAPEAVTVLAGAAFAGAAPVFQIFTLTLLMRVAAYGPMLQSIGETRALLVSSSLMIVTNLVLSYPFTLLFGFPGAAIASVVATVPPLFFTLWRISLGFGCTIRETMPLRHYAATLALASMLAVGLWFVRGALPGPAGVRLLFGAVGYCATFVVSGRLLRLIDDEDMAYLGQWLTLRMLRK